MSILENIARRVLNSKFDRLHRAINWEGMIDPDVVFMKNGNVMMTLRYQPVDAEVMSAEQQAAIASIINRTLMQFSGGWTFFFDHVRVESSHYDVADIGNDACRIMQAERATRFAGHGEQYENIYLVSFLFNPTFGITEDGCKKKKKSSSIRKRLNDSQLQAWQRNFNTFKSSIESAKHSINTVSRRVELFSGGELLAYLRFCVTGRWEYTEPPEFPVTDMGWLLEEDLECRWDDDKGEWVQKLGSKHFRTIVIDGQPKPKVQTLILNELNGAPFALRSTSRFQPLSREDALFEAERRRNGLNKSALPFSEYLSVNLKNKQADNSRRDRNKVMGAESGARAKAGIVRREISFGYWNHFVNVWGDTEQEVEEKRDWVERTIRASGFTCRALRWIDTMPGFLGSVPGHTEFLNRLFASSLTFAKALPSSAPWTGKAWDERLNGPPLLRGVSRAGTAVRFVMHRSSGAPGHGIKVGRSGSGKSTNAGTMIWNYLKYRNSRCVIMDYLASAKGVTYALGGDFYDLSDPGAISPQPLRDIHIESERSWAHQYICDRLAFQGLRVTADQKEEINKTLLLMASKPTHRRTMTVFQALVQDREIWSHIGVYVKGGSCGHVIDNESSNFGTSNTVTTFEMEKLLKNKEAADAVMPVVFHEIDKALNGDPMLWLIDEAQVFIREPWFQRELPERMETARKKYCDIWLVTPVLEEFVKSKMRAHIKSLCVNKIFFAEESATMKGYREAYEEFGLSSSQIATISRLMPEKEFMLVTEDGTAIIDQKLGQVELAFVGRNGDKDKMMMDKIIEESPEEYIWRWLEYCDIDGDTIAAFIGKFGDDETMPLEQRFMMAAE